jgi:hypothetical protein
VTAASPGTLGEVSGHAFSTRASLPPQVEALVDVIQDPIRQIEFLRKLIPPGFTSGCSSTPMTSPDGPGRRRGRACGGAPRGGAADRGAEGSAGRRDVSRPARTAPGVLQVFVGRIPMSSPNGRRRSSPATSFVTCTSPGRAEPSAGDRATTVCRPHGIPRAVSNRARPAARPGRTIRSCWPRLPMPRT